MEGAPVGLSGLISSETGALYAMPTTYINDTQTTINNYYLRFDTLQANGITRPESMDEIYEVCLQY